MTKITKQEIKKIAQMSRLEITEDEIGPLAKQLDDVLTYAACVTELAADVQEPSIKNINVFREDVVSESQPETILARAPEREEDFYVVPAIIEEK